jgi:hypothetical protein
VGVPAAPVGLQAEDPTIAELLKPLGYATGQFGKNHLGDLNAFLPIVHGFDEFFGNLYHLNAEEEPELPNYPRGFPSLQGEVRSARGAALLGHRQGRSDRGASLGPGRQAASAGHRRLSTSPTTATVSASLRQLEGRVHGAAAPGALQIWAEPFVPLRVPKLFNLRTDPFERADITSNTYYDWFLDNDYIALTAQFVMGQFLETFKEFPPRQKAASFTIDQAVAKLEAALTHGQ